MNERNVSFYNSEYRPPRNAGGARGLFIILIMLVLVSVGFKTLVLDKKTSTPMNCNTTVEKDTKKNNIPIEDMYALHIEGTSVYYYVLDNGNVYEYYKKAKTDEYGNVIDEITIDTSVYDGEDKEAISQFSKKKIEGLTNIKRIKGLISIGTDISKGLLVVTNDGKVLIYSLLDGDVNKASFLDDYKVDDVISYYKVPACISEDDNNFKTCGGRYHIKTIDGIEYNYIVKTDGSLVKNV